MARLRNDPNNPGNIYGQGAGPDPSGPDPDILGSIFGGAAAQQAPNQPNAQERPPIEIGASGTPGSAPAGAETGRSSEGPRERMPGGAMTAPGKSMYPSSMAGTTFSGPVPFDPMSGGDLSPMAMPKQGGLYGSLGGLQGGGIGVPLDPASNAASDPISTLIEALLGRARG